MVTVALAAVFSALLLSPSAAYAYNIGPCKFSGNRNDIKYSINMPSAYSPTFRAAASDISAKTDVGLVDAPSSTYWYIRVRDTGNDGNDGLTVSGCPAGYNITVQTYENPYYMDSASAAHKRVVWAHEIGHALGLGHVPQNTRLMYTCPECYRTQTGSVAPDSDTIAGINKIY